MPGFPRSILAVLILVLPLALAARPSAAEEVDLELVLAVDVSGSMDLAELELQREGYIAALSDPRIAHAIVTGPYGRIALTYVEWAGHGRQIVTVPWRLIDGEESARAFANALAQAPAPWIRGTSIGDGLLFAAGLFDANDHQGLRRVIDVSGDGPNNQGPRVDEVRDAVIARGITINGLPITTNLRMGSGLTAEQLIRYYRDCVIGGPGAFMLSVQDMDALADTIRRKLVLEIAGRTPHGPLHDAQAEDGPPISCLIGETRRQRQSDW